MEAMFAGLDLIGFNENIRKIRKEWKALIEINSVSPTLMYCKTCHRNFIEFAAIIALEGTKKLAVILYEVIQKAMCMIFLTQHMKNSR